jgi:hypothetical protein
MAASWLLFQAATMTFAAATVGIVPFVDMGPQCFCAHAAGDSAMCPMHHGPGRPTQPSGPVSAPPSQASPSHATHMGHAHVGHAAHAGQMAQGSLNHSRHGTCYMRNADNRSGVALVSVFGPLGLLAPSTFSSAPAIVNLHATLTPAAAIDRMRPPDPPPPRA